MPAISTTREISNEEWEDRKELIRELYLTQGRSLRGDEGVMMHLARLGFVARYYARIQSAIVVGIDILQQITI